MGLSGLLLPQIQPFRFQHNPLRYYRDVVELGLRVPRAGDVETALCLEGEPAGGVALHHRAGLVGFEPMPVNITERRYVLPFY